MESICFTVPGKPQGKARARTFYNKNTGNMSSITPKNTLTYEKNIYTLYLEQTNGYRFQDDSYIKITVTAYFEPPRSISKKKCDKMLTGEILPGKKPDIDNIVKAVLDALNHVAYKDDAQVVDLVAKKRYDSRNRIEICIETL